MSIEVKEFKYLSQLDEIEQVILRADKTRGEPELPSEIILSDLIASLKRYYLVSGHAKEKVFYTYSGMIWVAKTRYVHNHEIMSVTDLFFYAATKEDCRVLVSAMEGWAREIKATGLILSDCMNNTIFNPNNLGLEHMLNTTAKWF